MVLTSNNLLQDLLELTRKNLYTAKNFKNQSTDYLNWKENPESWSVLECIEHLNRYGDFYIPEIRKKIKTSQHKSSEIFKSNW